MVRDVVRTSYKMLGECHDKQRRSAVLISTGRCNMSDEAQRYTLQLGGGSRTPFGERVLQTIAVATQVMVVDKVSRYHSCQQRSDRQLIQICSARWSESFELLLTNDMASSHRLATSQHSVFHLSISGHKMYDDPAATIVRCEQCNKPFDKRKSLVAVPCQRFAD